MDRSEGTSIMKFNNGYIFGECGCVVGVDKDGNCDIFHGCVGHKSQLFSQALKKRLKEYETT